VRNRVGKLEFKQTKNCCNISEIALFYW